jgi:hypothetical protein
VGDTVLRVLIFLVVVTLGVWALLDVAQTPEARVRGFSKPVWSLVVIIPLLGPVAWFMQGRVPAPRATRTDVRPLAPDDDPDFLRKLRDRDRPDGSA